MLQYALYRNHLTEGEDDYTAIPQSLVNKNIEEIIHQITKPGSILKETECVAVIHDFFKAVAENLREGYGFNSDYIRLQPKLSGVFSGIDDQYDPERHQTDISINATAVLKDALKDLKLGKVEANIRKPEIKSVYDLRSQQRDAELSPGHMIELRGSYLKLNMDQPDEGIFLMNNSDNSEIRIEQIHENLPSKLSGMLPDDLPVGAFTLEVRNRLKGNTSLYTGVFTEELSVN